MFVKQVDYGYIASQYVAMILFNVHMEFESAVQARQIVLRNGVTH